MPLPLIWLVASISLLSGCLNYPNQQGNVLEIDKISALRQGMPRFQVESILGTPVLSNVLHKNKVIYMQDYEDENTGERSVKKVEITYNYLEQIENIDATGFESSP